MWVLWILAGIVLGAVVLLLVRRRLRQAKYQERRAERRARDAERLAELGSMTAGLAHEIKNPLSTIGLNAQLLAEGIRDANMVQEERERLLRRLEALAREVERLRGVLTDFLQFAGRVRLDPQPRNLADIVTDLADFFHPQCDQARVIMRTQLPPAPVMAHVDESLLKQALLNLMINATQAIAQSEPSGDGQAGPSSRGELILHLEADAEEARIHVIDTGPGIDAKRLEEIFRPYVSGTRGGTGLGLPTARRIIEEHGGTLVAHSETGRGSDFVIHLPLRLPAQAST